MNGGRLDEELKRAIDLGEIGVQVAAYLGEELIVDTFIGEADAESHRAVDSETLFPVIAVTKAISVTALHLQAERGLVDYAAPVASYWPEFAAEGKGNITVFDLITHRGGFPTPEVVTTDRLSDWDFVVGALAAVAPVDPPGTRSTFSGYSWGFSIGEIVRRTDPKGRSFRDFVAEEISGPLDIEDLWVGVPPSEMGRLAILAGEGQQPAREHSIVPTSLLPTPLLYNRPDILQACLPTSSGVMTARAGARFFSLLANGGSLGGVRLLSEARVRSFARPRPNPYEAAETITWIGSGGYWIGGEAPPADPVVGTGPNILTIGCHWAVEDGPVTAENMSSLRTYCSAGGGSIGWADIDSHLAVMICHNRMFSRVPVERQPFVGIAEAIRELAAERKGT